MANVNQVTLIGRLTRDPELRYISSGTAVTEISLAVNKEWWDKATNEKKKKVTFVDITCWAKTAEAVCQYMSKGRELYVFGELELDQWETPDGDKRSKLKVVAAFVQFLGGKDGSGGRREEGRPEPSEEGRPGRGDSAPSRPAPPPAEDFSLDEEDVPF